MNKLYLKCTASPGQFTDEIAISGHDHRGEVFSFFANPGFVELDGEMSASSEVPARLEVTGLAKDGDLVLIRLPGQAFGNGSTITVRESELERMECVPTR